jgi:hypothetical protein
MRGLTTNQQDEALRGKYSKVDTILLAAWGAVWGVLVTPADQAYRISLEYMRGGMIGDCRLIPSLAVRVLSPALARRAAAPDKCIPHLYREGDLCLYDPGIETEKGDWNRTMLIADTIVPWASEWLFFYELWHATGIWHGREVKH